MLLKVPLAEEDKREQLDVIRRSADRMNRLISDLLDVAQIEAGELALSLSNEEVQTLVREAVAAARDERQLLGEAAAKAEALFATAQEDAERLKTEASDFFSLIRHDAVRFQEQAEQAVAASYEKASRARIMKAMRC